MNLETCLQMLIKVKRHADSEFRFYNFSYGYLLLFTQSKLISNMIFLVVSLRSVAPNTSEQRSRSGLCKRVIRREATETEGLVR